MRREIAKVGGKTEKEERDRCLFKHPYAGECEQEKRSPLKTKRIARWSSGNF